MTFTCLCDSLPLSVVGTYTYTHTHIHTHTHTHTYTHTHTHTYTYTHIHIHTHTHTHTCLCESLPLSVVGNTPSSPMMKLDSRGLASATSAYRVIESGFERRRVRIHIRKLCIRTLYIRIL
jgi:hypothetical protein